MADIGKDIIMAMNQMRKPVSVPEPDPKLNEEKPAPEPGTIDKTNCVEIDGKLVEIFPTPLRYFDNNMVSFYHILDTVELPTIFQMHEENSGIEGRQQIVTFISAVLDDAKLAKKLYSKMTSQNLYDMVKIFKRINGITEREEARLKNAQATKGKA